MATHISVRMAWHDNRWNGKVCDNPTANVYCTSSHSLLSDRLARDKKPATEQPVAKKKLDVLMPEYIPPCYWTSAAFSPTATKTVHAHPFTQFKDTKRITEDLPPYSVFTWPYRLSLNQSKEANKRDGKYPADTDDRVDRYIAKLKKGKSLIFYYLNYDNPVSADEYAYLLVGCARLTDYSRTDAFEFSEKELNKLRSGEGMQNLPIRNWSIRLTCDVPNEGVLLPYHDYLHHIATHPSDEDKLNEMRIFVEEAALLPSFKYVSEHVNDDQCLYLLYKLARSVKFIAQHGIAKPPANAKKIPDFIQEFWTTRGLYPGLGNIVSLLADLSEGEAGMDASEGENFVADFRQGLPDDSDVLKEVFKLLESKAALAESLASHKRVVRRARKGLKDNDHLVAVIKKLSLFALTYRQVARALFPNSGDGEHPFGGKTITAKDIENNPYLLCENYVPATDDDKERSVDMDREQRTDGPIDYFTIDIGMFPDEDYLEPTEELHDLTIAGPQRLRAFVIEALKRNEGGGHTFATLGTVADAAKNHPIFYRNRLDVDETRFVSPACLKHFQERLFVEQLDGQTFFYLGETKAAEVTVERCLKELISLPPHTVDTKWIASYVKGESDEMSARIPDFERSVFEEERERLLEVALKNRLSVITGRPGSGKTHAIRELLTSLLDKGQKVTVLAPTGKAALRAKSESHFDNVQTIDRWIYTNALGDYAEDLSKLPSMTPSATRELVENLVIDEMSMVNLAHMAVILRALEVQGLQSVRRVVFIGDENQLPPIGCGRPLKDLLDYLQVTTGLAKQHWVSLVTNCRQRRDQTILHAAQLFAGKNRYHSELWDKLRKGGQVSEFLDVSNWSTAEDLHEQIKKKLNVLVDAKDKNRIKGFNLLLGLYDSGFAPAKDTSTLGIDNWQLLSPYRAGASGALGLNQLIRTGYRVREKSPESFGHGDKIIRIKNLYVWNKNTKKRELKLSNGSIGILCDHGEWKGQKAYFPESKWPLDWDRMDEEDFELAYSITVHKSQGSEFESVFLVIPERRSLLTRELIYTAMTRSKGPLAIFVQKSSAENPLNIARNTSSLLSRNSSLFSRPMDAKKILEPEDGVRVSSKVEYVIYEALRKHRDSGSLTFQYEEPRELTISGTRMKIHPDFTVRQGGKVWHWEHLGMLDRAIYSRNWKARFEGFKAEGLAPVLVTTDDLDGIKSAKVEQIISDILNASLKGKNGVFSEHHYTLSP